MDKITKGLIKQLIGRLEHISNTKPIGEDDRANDTKSKPDAEHREPSPAIPTSIGIPDPPPAVTHQYITYKPEQGWWDKAKPWVEIATLLALIVYTAYTIKMYWANRDAANAARSAAETASNTLKSSNESFELSMRPYLTASEATFRTPMKGGDRIQVQCVLRNIGRVPASEVHGVAELIWHDNAFPLQLPPPHRLLRTAQDIGSIGVPLVFTSDVPIPRNMVDKVTSTTKGAMLIFYGEISYSSEIFPSPYPPLRFCFWFNTDTADFAGCRIPAYNTAVQIN